MSEYFVGSTGANNQTNFSSLDTSEVLDDLGLNTGDSPIFSGLFLEGSGSTIFSVDGSNGRLFGVTDEVTGTVFSVNDAAGLPIIEVESTSGYDKIALGEYGSDLLVLSGQSTIEITGSQIASESWVGQQGYVTSTTAANDATITLSGGTEITTTIGDFTTNQSSPETLTINHANVSRTNTTNSASPAFGGTFTVVDGVTSNARGHVTAENVKTITLPSLGTTSTTALAGNTTVNDVSETNLLNRLALLDSSDTIYIGDAGDDTTVVVRGTLQVDGSTTTINSNTLSIGDNQIVLNNDVTGTPTQNAGIIVERGSQTNASLIWDETSSEWKAGTVGNEIQIVLGNGNYSGLRAQATTKGDVGLGNVTNESKATMFSGAALTGNSTATTQLTGDSSTRIATTAYVKGQNYISSVTASDIGLGNVTNESKATMFTSPSFTGDVVITDDTFPFIRSSTNGSGAGFKFSDNSGGTYGQQGTLTFRHSDTASYGSGASFEFATTEGTCTILGGKLMYGEGIYSKPATGTGAGTRKDSNWDTAYTHTSATNNPHSVTATQVGLGNVTNESKATMFASPTFTGTVSGVTKAHVGLGSVTNESKATMFASAALTGNPTATTQLTGDNSTRIATTAYVKGQNYISSVTASDIGLGNVTNESKATMFASPTFTGTVSGVTKAHVGLGNVTNESKATMFASAALTGNPTAPTQASSESSTKIATTAYVKSQSYLTSYTETDTLATVTGRGRTTSTNGSAVWSATTQGTNQGSMHLMSIASDHAGGAITFDASDSNGAQAGIYVKSDGSYGTKMYLSTTDSYASGSKSAISINHQGYVNIVRGNDRLTVNGNSVFHDGYHPNADTLTTARTIAGTSFNGSANIDISYNNLTNKPTIPSAYSLPEATATVRGGIELFSNTDQSVAANSVSATASRTYGIQLNSAGQAVVNVPWSDTNTVYSHPTHNGDDINIDTGALTGATVISDLDFNITTNSLGHVTDANGSVSTRTLTAANLGISAPNAPASASVAIVGETVEVTFAASTTSNIDAYLVYSSIDGSDYGLISIVPPDDFAASMSIIDNAFDETGTQAYRVYAMKYGILSSAASDSVSYTVSSAEPTTMSVVNLNNAYYVQWNPPSSNARFVTAYNVYKHEHATQGSLSRGSASLVYSGMNTNYMYQISGTNNNNFHQFWVETTIA